MQRHCRQRAEYLTVITFDGSLTGGGATLQCGVPSLEAACSSKILAYKGTQWSDADLELLKVKRGDPQGQARVEAYTLLIAIRSWTQILMDSQGSLAIRGDALGVLYDGLRVRARESIPDDLAGEMALLSAPWGWISVRSTFGHRGTRSVTSSAGEVYGLSLLRGAVESRPRRPRPTLLGV